MEYRSEPWPGTWGWEEAAAFRHRRIENALWAWRESARQLQEDPNHACRRVVYERAIAAVLPALDPLATMDALLHVYFDERRMLHQRVEDACRTTETRRPLSRTLVKEAALWRRAAKLLWLAAP